MCTTRTLPSGWGLSVKDGKIFGGKVRYNGAKVRQSITKKTVFVMTHYIRTIVNAFCTCKCLNPTK